MVKKENCVIWIQILYADFCLYTFYVYMKTDDIYGYIVEDVETIYELNRLLPIFCLFLKIWAKILLKA